MSDSEQSDERTVQLEAVDVPKPDADTVTMFRTDELTAVCPFDFGGPDFYTLTLRYDAPGRAVESKSLKKYIESFRNRELTAEALAAEIYDDVVATVEPDRCYLRLEQARRGGIEETIEVGEYGLRE